MKGRTMLAIASIAGVLAALLRRLGVASGACG
jgi:hypothetical protein